MLTILRVMESLKITNSLHMELPSSRLKEEKMLEVQNNPYQHEMGIQTSWMLVKKEGARGNLGKHIWKDVKIQSWRAFSYCCNPENLPKFLDAVWLCPKLCIVSGLIKHFRSKFPLSVQGGSWAFNASSFYQHIASYLILLGYNRPIGMHC